MFEATSDPQDMHRRTIGNLIRFCNATVLGEISARKFLGSCVISAIRDRVARLSPGADLRVVPPSSEFSCCAYVSTSFDYVSTSFDYVSTSFDCSHASHATSNSLALLTSLHKSHSIPYASTYQRVLIIVRVNKIASRMKNARDYLLNKRAAMSSASLSRYSLFVCSTVRVLPTMMSPSAEVWYLLSNLSPSRQIEMSVLERIPVAELQDSRTISANGITSRLSH